MNYHLLGRKIWNDETKFCAGKDSFIRNGAKLWNAVPQAVSESKTLSAAKKAIKTYCMTLPV